jgi:hypothetical protein
MPIFNARSSSVEVLQNFLSLYTKQFFWFLVIIMELFSKQKPTHAAAPPPPPLPPPPPSSSSTTQAQKAQKPVQIAHSPGTIGIGIETEFLLVARDRSLARENIRDFSRALAAGYKQSISGNPNKHPGMHNAINESYLGERFSEWSLDFDTTIETPKPGQELCKCSSNILQIFINTNEYI